MAKFRPSLTLITSTAEIFGAGLIVAGIAVVAGVGAGLIAGGIGVLALSFLASVGSE